MEPAPLGTRPVEASSASQMPTKPEAPDSEPGGSHPASQPEIGSWGARAESSLPRILRWGTPFLVFFIAFAFYHHQVGEPSLLAFDEFYYVPAARDLLRGTLIDPKWPEPRPINYEHPPMGKYLIALGIQLSGNPHEEIIYNTFYTNMCKTDNPECARDAHAWRIATVTLASLGVLGIYWVGLRLFNRFSAGVIASALLLLDGFYFVHARLALLDPFMISLLLLAFGVALGRTRFHAWTGSVLFGLALGTKFPALFLLPPFFLLHLLRSPRLDPGKRLGEALVKAVIVPGAVFVALYAPFFVEWYRIGGGGSAGIVYAIHTFLFVEKDALRWTYAGQFRNYYASEPWTWILLARPIPYYVAETTAGTVRRILSLGNPFLWWTAAAALVGFAARALFRWTVRGPAQVPLSSLWTWLRRPFQFTRSSSLWFAVFLFLSAYGPFFLLQRQQFNFYFLLACPFLSLFAAGILSENWDRRSGRRLLVLLYLVIAAAAFTFYYPLYSGLHISEAHFEFVYGSIPWMAR